jgi:integrase
VARGTRSDAVLGQFRKLVRGAGVVAPGFYSLRHTFRTVADALPDRPAIDLIMGHHDPSMGGVYRERIADDRLQAVTDHVRKWLWPEQSQPKRGPRARRKK